MRGFLDSAVLQLLFDQKCLMIADEVSFTSSKQHVLLRYVLCCWLTVLLLFYLASQRKESRSSQVGLFPFSSSLTMRISIRPGFTSKWQ